MRDCDQESLENLKTRWICGGWEKIASEDFDELLNHQDRDQMSIIIASAYQQMGEQDMARQYARMALDWGCPKIIVAKVLIAGVHNTLGRISGLAENDDKLNKHFKDAACVFSENKDRGIAGQVRAVREIAELGLLSKASSLLEHMQSYGSLASGKHAGIPFAEEMMKIVGEVESKLQYWSVNRGGYYNYVPAIHAKESDAKAEEKRIVICTHHKAGTNFLLKTFKAIANEFGYSVWSKFYDPFDEPKDWKICIEQHSRVSDIIKKYNFSGLHVIRHPMALIHSAALYHMKCKEPWVDIPLQKFTGSTFWSATHGPLYNKIKDATVSMEEKIEMMNSDYICDIPSNLRDFSDKYCLEGRTYREQLLQLPTIEERVLFEMNAYSYGVISDMSNFPFDKRFNVVNIESISFDSSMFLLKQAFNHLGFRGRMLERCLDIAKENSIWNDSESTARGHATTGMSESWRNIFQGRVLKEYRELFGSVEESLGFSSLYTM